MDSDHLNSQAQFSYLERVSELAKEDPRYSPLDYEILTTESDPRDGGWAIMNVITSDAGVFSQSSNFNFDTEHSRSSFYNKLMTIPPEARTRVILVLTGYLLSQISVTGVDKGRGTPEKAEELLHAITRLWNGMTNSKVESAA